MRLYEHASTNSSQAPGLIHPQAGQVRRAADFHPGSAQGIRFVMLAIFVQHRTVPRVLELHLFRGLALDGNRLAKDAHLLPAAEIAVLARVLWIHVIHVQIFVVLAEDRQPPTAVLVVADGHARQDGLASADDVPSRRLQVNKIAQRRRGQRPMRVIDDVGKSRLRETAAHHPVVGANLVGAVAARDGGDAAVQRIGRRGVAMSENDVFRLEGQRAAKGLVETEDLVIQQRPVDGRIQLEQRIARTEPIQLLDFGGSDRSHGSSQLKFDREVREEPLVTRNHHGRRPLAGGDAE